MLNGRKSNNSQFSAFYLAKSYFLPEMQTHVRIHTSTHPLTHISSYTMLEYLKTKRKLLSGSQLIRYGRRYVMPFSAEICIMRTHGMVISK